MNSITIDRQFAQYKDLVAKHLSDPRYSREIIYRHVVSQGTPDVITGTTTTTWLDLKVRAVKAATRGERQVSSSPRTDVEVGDVDFVLPLKDFTRARSSGDMILDPVLEGKFNVVMSDATLVAIGLDFSKAGVVKNDTIRFTLDDDTTLDRTVLSVTSATELEMSATWPNASQEGISAVIYQPYMIVDEVPDEAFQTSVQIFCRKVEG